MGLAVSGGSGRRRGRRSPFTEINIVPLTDVVLVLLIIFMVTAQFIEHDTSGMDLNLPSASQVQDLDDLGGIRVSVDRDGQFKVAGMPTAPEEVAAALRQVMRSPEQLVVVEGDRETVLQNVVTIMDAAMAAGLPNVVLATAAETSVTVEPGPEAPAAEPVAPAAEPAGDALFMTPLPAP